VVDSCFKGGEPASQHRNSNCQPFINFMLDAIEKTLLEYVENQKTQSNGGLFGGLFGGLNILEKDIVSLIKEKPNIRIFEIAQILLKPVRTIENNISRLKEKGVLKRIGSKKTGYWEVLKF
jgi:predicted HTH transcriptional regulator